MRKEAKRLKGITQRTDLKRQKLLDTRKRRKYTKQKHGTDIEEESKDEWKEGTE